MVGTNHHAARLCGEPATEANQNVKLDLNLNLQIDFSESSKIFNILKSMDMKIRQVAFPLFLVCVLGGCATQVSPQMRELAEKRKGEVVTVSTSLEASDNFEKRCGYAKPNESVGCSQDILWGKLRSKAKDYCVNYSMGRPQYNGTSGALYNRATSAQATITCLGS